MKLIYSYQFPIEWNGLIRTWGNLEFRWPNFFKVFVKNFTFSCIKRTPAKKNFAPPRGEFSKIGKIGKIGEFCKVGAPFLGNQIFRIIPQRIKIFQTTQFFKSSKFFKQLLRKFQNFQLAIDARKFCSNKFSNSVERFEIKLQVDSIWNKKFKKRNKKFKKRNKKWKKFKKKKKISKKRKNCCTTFVKKSGKN